MALVQKRAPQGSARPAFVSVAPGFEPALVRELQEIGVQATEEPGGAAFTATAESLALVHRFSRIAGRVTVKIGAGGAGTLEELAQTARSMPWKDYIPAGQPVAVKATANKSRLHFTATIGKKVELAITDAMRGPRLSGPRPPREPAPVIVRVEGDRASFFLDASGELMHRRGWRLDSAKAPIRENLGAAILAVAEWEVDEPLVDPMCGSGTFAIEAAGIALGDPPGDQRSFAFLNWPSFPAKVWPGAPRSPRPKGIGVIVASDRDPGAVRATTENARRAGVAAHIKVLHRPFVELEPPARTGLVVMNPPYGRRIGEGDSSNAVFRHIGTVLRERWSGWRLAILIPDRALLRDLGIPVESALLFSNGGLKVGLFIGEVR